MTTAHTAMPTWKQQCQAAYQAGRDDFANDKPCSNQQYIANVELGDCWEKGNRDAFLDTFTLVDLPKAST